MVSRAPPRYPGRWPHRVHCYAGSVWGDRESPDKFRMGHADSPVRLRYGGGVARMFFPLKLLRVDNLRVLLSKRGWERAVNPRHRGYKSAWLHDSSNSEP